MINVFLSASVPLPSRDPAFFRTADVIAIREAIKALVEIVLPVGRITCGGHPAITPLLALFARQARLPAERVAIFQSAFFEADFPREVQEFVDLHITEVVNNNREDSLARMREEMLGSQNFDYAVLIGGMEGVLVEGGLFRDNHPTALILSIASTGAAAAQFFNSGHYAPELRTELTYPTLFRRFFVQV